MSAEVQGLLKFVSTDGLPALMMDRVSAMVAELEALGAVPVVTVTVELALTSRSSSSPISAATGMSGRGAGVTSTSPDPIRPSAEGRSGIDGGQHDATVSAASMSAGEDFLGGARGEGRGAEENGQRSMVDGQLSTVDWSSGGPYLSTEAWTAVTDLESGALTWRGTKKSIRLELVQKVLVQPTESGKAMTTGQFDQIRPLWMSKAGNLTNMFGCSWPELRTLRLSE